MIVITPVTPLADAVGVARDVVIQVNVEASAGRTINASTVVVRLRQQPSRVSDGWMTAYTGEAFQAGFEGIYASAAYDGVPPTSLVLEIDPEFGLLPGGVFTAEVTAADDLGASTTVSWSFTAADDAPVVLARGDLSRLLAFGASHGWQPVLSGRSTYTFESEERWTGAAAQFDVNESLAADVGDQLEEPPFGLDPLRNQRRYALLARLASFPRDVLDPVADVLFDGYASLPTPVFANRHVPGTEAIQAFTMGSQTERLYRCATLFLQVPPTVASPDWGWVYSEKCFAVACPSGRYGHGALMFARGVPRAHRLYDSKLGSPLERFLGIPGAVLDALKTALERPLDFYDPVNVDARWLPYIDALVGWPTNAAADEDIQRQETLAAVETWKAKGTLAALVELLDILTDWDVSTAEGWRYVLRTNDVGSTLLDPTSVDLTDTGYIEDTIAYTPLPGTWHALNGLAVQLTQPAASTPDVPASVIARIRELLPILVPSWADVDLLLRPFEVETVPDSWIMFPDEWVPQDAIPAGDTAESDFSDPDWEIPRP